jgi:surface protein
VNSFECACAAGYTGVVCDSATNECGSSPCQNGGTCRDGVNSFECACAAGYTGVVCDSATNECGSSPCQNGGTCRDGVNSFECACATGFSGAVCDTSAGPCSGSPCQYGTCSAGSGSRPYVCSAFVSVWDTTKTSSGSSSSNQIKLPLEGSGTYNFLIEWGDGQSETITSSTALHTYATSGQYTVVITGTLIGWRFNRAGDKLKLLDIKQWGTMRLGNSGSYFAGVTNLVGTAVDNLDLTGTANMFSMFSEASNFNGAIGGWDMSGVTKTEYMFDLAVVFNQDISGWDVSQVTDFQGMFYTANAFNQDISGWDVSSATDMVEMFAEAASFDRDISGWCVNRISSRPTDFDKAPTLASWTSAEKPQWGQCPSS